MLFKDIDVKMRSLNVIRKGRGKTMKGEDKREDVVTAVIEDGALISRLVDGVILGDARCEGARREENGTG